MWLGISTATGHLGLALVSDEGLVAEWITAIGQEHSEALFQGLEALFHLSGTARSQVKGLGVAVGPGAFTGVRSGVALAKACAMGLDVPAHGVGTLEALAHPHLGPDRVVASMLDARRGMVYVGAFGPGGEALMEESLMPASDAVLALQALGPWRAKQVDTVKTLSDGNAPLVETHEARPSSLILLGEGLVAHQQALLAALPHASALANELSALRPSSVAAIARKKHLEGHFPAPEALHPRYLREPKAVVEWEAAQARQGQGS